MPLFGKDQTFYTLLDQQADAAVRSAATLYALSRDFGGLTDYVSQINQIEIEADKLTQQMARKIDAANNSPISKRDLHALSNGLDDITDYIDLASARMALYRLPQCRPDLEPLVEMLFRVAQHAREAVVNLRSVKNQKSLRETFGCVQRLKSESDQIYLQALATLLNAIEPDPVMIIKWKEIYDSIGQAIDKCEEVTDIIQSIVVKHT